MSAASTRPLARRLFACAPQGALRLRVVAMTLLLCVVSTAHGDETDAGSETDASSLPASAGTPGGVPLQDAGTASDEPWQDPRTAQVRALIAGTLDESVEPARLFDVSLQDEQSIDVERTRVQLLLKASQPAPAPKAKEGRRAKDAAVPVEAGADEERFRASLALDEARLAFYRLPKETRAQLLAAHAQKQAAANAPQSVSDPARNKLEEDRRQSLEAARAARSEAERLVAEEHARLLGMASAVADLSKDFEEQQAEFSARRDRVFGWQRRVRDVKASLAEDADATYDALRKQLRAARGELDEALDVLDNAASRVPDLGPNPLDDVPPELHTEQVREQRTNLERALGRARVDEENLRKQRAGSLLEEVDTLNRERLSLLPYLSSEKRGSITGFTEAGFDQARSEARHLLLILRYHHHKANALVGELRQGGGVRGVYAWRVGVVAVPWLLATLVFLWWRKNAPSLFARALAQSAQADRAERRTSPSALYQALHFVQAVQRPLSSLLFLGMTVWLLPDAVLSILEVQLLVVIVGWSLGASLVILAINAVATFHSRALRAADDTAALRLRSLRLVGRIVVVFGLVLVLSGRLVGEGTLYEWVLAMCWFAVIPLFLVLVRWWRETVFERLVRLRRKTPLENWILANRSGWKSFLAATVAAVRLFATGTFKTVVNWASSFDLARRAHAYLFKRELDRLTVGKPSVASHPLRSEALGLLSPTRCSERWTESTADEHLATVRSRLSMRRAGVVALVGGLGMGKSSLFRRLVRDVPGTVLIRCQADSSVESLLAAVAASAATNREGTDLPKLVLLDDAHTLVKPVVRGLLAFDNLITEARARSVDTLWVLSLDSVVWPFLRRARDNRTMFDSVLTLEPWTEEQIGELLSQRSEEAGVQASFEDLLDKLPPSADEIDKQEALQAKREGYHRMVWDYARGNPGIALEVWRSSLVEDEQGLVHVRPLCVPQTAPLEALPDAALFVLRAVLQMAPASVEDIAQATRIAPVQIENALRFGQGHGYLVEEGGRMRVSWFWLRAVLVLLQRRHLLVGS